MIKKILSRKTMSMLQKVVFQFSILLLKMRQLKGSQINKVGTTFLNILGPI